MSKHKPIPKAKRIIVYHKYKGHCAYCGCELEYKDMQVDHIESVYKNCDLIGEKSLNEINVVDNLMPSCRMCNFYKSTLGIEDFRKRITDTLIPNLKKTFDYRFAEKYGLISETNKYVKFYFEKMEEL